MRVPGDAEWRGLGLSVWKFRVRNNGAWGASVEDGQEAAREQARPGYGGLFVRGNTLWSRGVLA